MKFTGEGSKKFADITGQLAQKQSPQNQFAIVLDGEVVSDPYVRQALTGGNAEISGNFNQQSAQELANMLSYGALPLTFREDSVTTVTAALGGEQLQAGLIAGAIGLALVILYLLFYYRGLSFIAVASLMVSAALTYVIMALLGPTIGFALNLPSAAPSSPSASRRTRSSSTSNGSGTRSARAARCAPPWSGPGRAPGAPSWSPTSCPSSPPRCSSWSPSARCRASRSPWV